MSLFVVQRKERLRLTTREAAKRFYLEYVILEKKPYLVRWDIVCMDRSKGGWMLEIVYFVIRFFLETGVRDSLLKE